jgi:hypothetical protein
VAQETERKETSNQVKFVNLDCTSHQSTQSSLAEILGISQEALIERISVFDLGRHWAETPSDYRKPGEILLEELCKQGARARLPENISWFHGTRVVKPQLLHHGIRPLNAQLDPIWDDLFNIARGYVDRIEWDNFRNAIRTNHDSHHAHLYREKSVNPIHWGPHAVLVRDVFLRPEEFASIDYLRSPEIVEDICICFHEYTGHNLLHAFQQQSRSCIVKFRDTAPRPDALLAALYYLYCIIHKMDLFKDCNTCFDGQSVEIPSDHILGVEIIS